MKKHRNPPYKNPLDWFLRQGYESSLAIAADEVASQSFDAVGFRQALSAKLERLRYPQPRPKSSAPTFDDIVARAGVRNILLNANTMLELWKFRSIKEIFERVAYQDSKNLAPDGIPVKEHQERTTRILKDQLSLRQIDADYGLGITEDQYRKFNQKVMEEMKWILYAGLPRHKEELLASPQADPNRVYFRGGQMPHGWPLVMIVKPGRTYGRRTNTSQNQQRTIRSEHTAIQVNIFRYLQRKLQTAKSKQKGLSDIFLCQLSELVWAEDNVPSLTDGETVRRATKRIPR